MNIIWFSSILFEIEERERTVETKLKVNFLPQHFSSASSLQLGQVLCLLIGLLPPFFEFCWSGAARVLSSPDPAANPASGQQGTHDNEGPESADEDVLSASGARAAPENGPNAEPSVPGPSRAVAAHPPVRGRAGGGPPRAALRD